MAEEKLLNRIRGLLEKAESTTFEGEREALLAKAQRLMDQHRIDEALLSYKKGPESRKAISYEVVLPPSKFEDKKYSLLYHISEHCGVRVAWAPGKAIMVGMQGAIEMAELLYTLAVLEFDSRIDPTWDSEKSFDANVKALQEAGKKWKTIAHIANRNGGNPRTGQPGSTTDGSWLLSAYRRECKRLGEEPRRQTQRHEVYQESFASSFLATTYNRLEKMRKVADEQRGEELSRLPAIMSEQDLVNAEYWRLFPHLHPQRQKEAREATLERERQRRAKMTQAERDAEDKAREKWSSKLGRTTTTYDEAGWAAGDKAAKRVDLLGGKNRVQNVKELG